MIRVLGIGLVVMGSAAATLPAHAEEEQDGRSVFTANVSPDRVYRGPGVQPVSDAVPPAVDIPEKRPATVESADAPSLNPLADTCPDGGGWDRSRSRNYPRRPCYVNDQYEPIWYIAPIIGMQDQPNQAVKWSGQGFRIEPQGGPQGGVAFGWATGPTWLGRNRIEFELAARSNEFDGLQINNVTQQASGELTAVSAMMNYVWDFKHPDRDWYPYIGVGAGLARVKFESGFGPFNFADEDDSTDEVFAFQTMTGVSYRLRSYVEVFAEARYFGTSTADFKTTSAGFVTPAGVIIPAGVHKLTSDFNSFGGMIGARILLGKRRCVDDVPSVDGRPTSGYRGWRYRGWN